MCEVLILSLQIKNRSIIIRGKGDVHSWHSCFYHDAAICLLRDGVPVAAVDEQALREKT